VQVTVFEQASCEPADAELQDEQSVAEVEHEQAAAELRDEQGRAFDEASCQWVIVELHD
jgi:hypothetical protein